MYFNHMFNTCEVFYDKTIAKKKDWQGSEEHAG